MFSLYCSTYLTYMAGDVTSTVVPSVIEPLSVRVKVLVALTFLATGALVAAMFPTSREVPATNSSYLLTYLSRSPFSHLELEILEPMLVEPQVSDSVYHGETTPDTMVRADVSEHVAQQYSLTGSSPNTTSRLVGVTNRKEPATPLTTADYPTELPGLLAKEMDTTRRKFFPVEPTDMERHATVFPESPFPESAVLTEQKSPSKSPSDSSKTDTAKVAAEKETTMKLADDDRYGKLVPIRQWNGAPIVDSSDLVPVQLFSSLNTELLVPIGNK